MAAKMAALPGKSGGVVNAYMMMGDNGIRQQVFVAPIFSVFDEQIMSYRAYNKPKVPWLNKAIE